MSMSGAVLSGAAASAATSDLKDFIPSSMDELDRHYRGFILGMVRKNGVPDQEAEDVVQYILERLDKTGALAQYDPEYLSEHQGRLVRTKFSTFLGAKVQLYCRGERGRIGKRAGHELLIMDAPVEDGTSLAELIGPPAACDDYSRLDAEEFIARMREQLAAVPPRSARDTCDLVALFDEVVAEWNQTGRFTYEGIQRRFGISGTTAGAWLSRLRRVLKQALGRPSVTIGGVALMLEEVAEAVKILRTRGGTAVAQPLRAAGHPLADAEKGWYHPFAKEEIKKFPSIAVEPGTKTRHEGHVKLAVIHRLERILAEVGAQVQVPDLGQPEPVSCPEPEPEPEVTPEEEFEAALWRYITDSAEMDRLKSLAQRAYAVPA